MLLIFPPFPVRHPGADHGTSSSPRRRPDGPLALDGLRVGEVVLDVDDAHPGVPGDPPVDLVPHGTGEGGQIEFYSGNQSMFYAV